MSKKIVSAVAATAALLITTLPITSVRADNHGHGSMGHKPMPMKTGMHKIGPMTVKAPWARASAGPARAGAAYFTIRNAGAAEDRLIAASTEISSLAELHAHVMQNEVMRMRKMKAVAVPAGKTTAFEPGGHHVMLMGLNKPLVEGESFALTLTFENAGSITVPVAIMGVAARGHGGGHGGHK